MSDSYRLLKDLFLKIRDLPPHERKAILDRDCQNDIGLRGEVEKLLRAHDEGSDYLSPAGEQARSLTPNSGLQPGDRVGDYSIVGVLGEGGMGVVYRAKQRRPERVVALKVIRPGWMSPPLLRRFENEAEVLGRLLHPGIAQIYAAGTETTKFGAQPYFAMELVEGLSITEYASKKDLDDKAKVELVARACDAVHHAHQNYIIHRDLKPGNLLIDASGQPKILDFGVARMTDADASTRHSVTATGQVIGTLCYMSPEQASGESSLLDDRTDVYSLGVILYQLLVGRLPHDLRGMPLGPAIRLVVESDIHPPSSVGRPLPEDLETILLKALSKDLERRYESAQALGDDLRRFLSDQPILARPTTTLYQLTKFARRNKGLVAGILSSFLILLVGAIVSTALAIHANERAEEAENERNRANREARAAHRASLDAETQRQRAEGEAVESHRQAAKANREAIAAKEVADWLVELFQVNEPNRSLGTKITAREILDRAKDTIDVELSQQPWLRSRLMVAIGRAYSQLAMYPEAEPLLEKAVELQRGSERVTPLELADTLHVYGDFLGKRNRFDEAIDAIGESLEIRLGELPEDHADIATSHLGLGSMYARSDRFAEAIDALEQAKAISSVVQPGSNSLAQIYNELGSVYQKLARYALAAENLEKAQEMWSRVLPEGHPRLAQGYNTLGLLHQDLGNKQQAEDAYLKTLAILERTLPPGHMNLALINMNLALLLADSGSFENAEAYVDQLLEVVEVGGLTDWKFHASSLNIRGRSAADREDYDLAMEHFEQAIQIAEEGGGPEDLQLASHLLYFGQICLEAYELERAEEVIQRGLSIREKKYAPDHPRIADALFLVGRYCVEVERYSDAAVALERALAIDSTPGRVALETWASALRGLGRDKEADAVDRRLEGL